MKNRIDNWAERGGPFTPRGNLASKVGIAFVCLMLVIVIGVFCRALVQTDELCRWAEQQQRLAR